MRKILVVLAAALSGCSVIGHEKVEGWPQVEVVEHYVPHAEMRDRCAPYVGFGMSPEACAEFDLVTLKCHIWFSADFPPEDFIVKHERMHCAGYDHVGSTGMQRYLSYHRSRGLLGSAASGRRGPRARGNPGAGVLS